MSSVEFHLRGKHSIPRPKSPVNLKKRRLEAYASSLAEKQLAQMEPNPSQEPVLSNLSGRLLEKEVDDAIKAAGGKGKKRLIRHKKNEAIKKARPASAGPSRIGQIYEFYGIDSCESYGSDNLTELAELQKQVLSIEDYLTKHLSNQELKYLRDKIKEICSSKTSHQEKMGQLGMLFYFIERDNKIPDFFDVDFIAMSAQELLDEIEILKTSYKSELGEKIDNIPSGKMHALLSTCARMVITREQTVNKGALYALLNMFDSTELARHVRPEHYEHLLCVFRKLQEEASWVSLIEKQHPVHPEMAPLVRLDLKLPFDETVTSLHAARACIMSLLFDITQNEHEGNCYAIASLKLASEQSIDKLLSNLLHLLSTGSLTLPHGDTLPLLPLIERRLTCDADFEIFITASEIASLKVFKEMCAAHHLDGAELPNYEGEESLLDSLTDFLYENNQENNLLNVQRFFQSYKTNALIALMLMETELKNTNFDDFRERDPSPSEAKSGLITALMLPLTKGVKGPFSEKLRENMERAFWIEPHPDRDIKYDGESILLGTQDHLRFIQQVGVDEEKTIREALQESSKLYFSWKGQLRLIDSISSLQRCMDVLAQETVKELGSNEEDYTPLKNDIFSRAYQKKAAEFCAALMQKEGHSIEADTLVRCDLLLINQLGGDGGRTFKRTFQTPLRTRVLNSTSAANFLFLLHQSLKRMGPAVFKNNHLMMAETPIHSFTLRSQRCEILRQAPNFSTLMKDKVYDRAADKLDKKIPRRLKKRILRRVARDESRQNALKGLFLNTQQSTYRQFRDAVADSDLLSLEETAQFLKIVCEEYSKTTLTEENTERVLKELIPDIKKEDLDSIWADFKIKHEGRRMKPYLYARALSRLLVKHLHTVIDPYALEVALCKVKQMPLSFDVGDPNWVDAPNEAPVHQRVMVAYNFSSDKMSFFIREKGREIVEDKKDYASFEVSCIRV